MDKGEQKKEAGQLQSDCEKNRKIIRRSRELLAAIDQRLAAGRQHAPSQR